MLLARRACSSRSSAAVLQSPLLYSRPNTVKNLFPSKLVRHALPYRSVSVLAAAGQAKLPKFSWYFSSNASGAIPLSNSLAAPAWTHPVAVQSKTDDAPSTLRPLGSTAIAPYPPPPLEAYKPIPALNTRRLLKAYVQLSKARLTSLVVLTAMSGVALSPLPATVPVLLATGIGTTLCAVSAAAFNQLAEVPFDAQMTRTRTRPLVARVLTPLHAASFGLVTGIAGPAILYTLVNPLTAALGAFNIVLYAGAYTWLKRRSVVNTWVGSVVGGLPPLMGWTACGGQLLPSSTYPIEFFLPPFLTDITPPLQAVDNPLSAFALFMILFSWQFPHFNTLAHLTRAQYAQAGYYMLSVISPSKNALVSLRHAALFFPLCSILTPLAGLTTWMFALTSLVPNAILFRSAWKFWKTGTDKDARKTFYNCLWHLPVILGLMMFHKQGTSWLESLGWKSETTEEAEVPAKVLA